MIRTACCTVALCCSSLIPLAAATAASAQGTGFWHTSGARILDANQQPVRIAGINWYGFETSTGVANGLTTQDYKSVLRTVHTLGYNTVRIPLSNQVVEHPAANLSLGAWHGFGPINSELQGLNSLQVLDRIVDYAGNLGLKVILDNHRSAAGSGPESSGLWFSAEYPESAWIKDWRALAARYLGNPTVIGFDLRNEPHNAASGGACWDCGGARDWHLAAQRAGNAVLAINPQLLIFVEGTDSYRGDSYWWGGNLEGVAHSPVTLRVPHQLVYSAHDYGPQEHRQPWFNASTSPASLVAVWTRHWAYISQRNLAPVWLGEFGTTNSNPDLDSLAPGSQGQWFASLVQFLDVNPALHWTYWALNGEDSYGLLDPRYGPSPVNPLKRIVLSRIQFPLSTYAAALLPAPATPQSLEATLRAPGSSASNNLVP